VTLVIDASVALTWCFEDEASPETDVIADRVGAEGGRVPDLFRLEIANILVGAERKGRISAADTASFLKGLDGLSITIDQETSARAWRDTLALARSERLSAYDAAYLELALRSGAALATRDGELAAAARRLGVVVLP